MMSSYDYSPALRSIRIDDLLSSPDNHRLSDYAQMSKVLREENFLLRNCLRVLRENTDIQASTLIASIIGWNNSRTKDFIPELEKYKDMVQFQLPGDQELGNSILNASSPYNRYTRASGSCCTTSLPGSQSIVCDLHGPFPYQDDNHISPMQRNMSAFSKSDDTYQMEYDPPEEFRAGGNEPEYPSDKDLPKLAAQSPCVQCRGRTPPSTTQYPSPPTEYSDTKYLSPKSAYRAGHPRYTSTPRSGNSSPRRGSPANIQPLLSPSKLRKSPRTLAKATDPNIRESRTPSPCVRAVEQGTFDDHPEYGTTSSRASIPLTCPVHDKELPRGKSPLPQLAATRRSPYPTDGSEYRAQPSCTDDSCPLLPRTGGPASPSFRPINSTCSSTCSEPPGSLLPGSRASTPHTNAADDMQQTEPGETYPRNYRILGEIAFQLERRILDFVFSGDKSKQAAARNRRRFYGYTVSNIPSMIAKEAEGEDGQIDPKRDYDIRERLERITETLGALGYDMDKHGVLSQKIINKYGLLGTIPNKSTMDAFGMNDEETLRQLVGKITCDEEERKNMSILLECLLLLARQDGKPLLLW